MLGEKREYLTIKILHNDMTVMVPSDNAGQAGLRRVIGEEDVERVLSVLRDDMSQMPKNWNRRFKHNRDKIKTGDVFELAEVVRNLAIRENEKGLSTGEKQMFTRAKKILASELMYALEMEEEEAEEYLDDLHRGGARASATAPPASGEVSAERSDGRRRDRSRRRQRRTPWRRRPKAFVVVRRPSAARLEPRRARGRSATGWSWPVPRGMTSDEGPDRVRGRRLALGSRCATRWRPRPRRDRGRGSRRRAAAREPRAGRALRGALERGATARSPPRR